MVSFFAAQSRADDDYDPKAIEYGQQGCEAMNKNDYEKAIKLFTKAIKIAPKFDKAYYNRGLSYKKMEKYEKALADYNKAIELNSNYTLALEGRGWVLQHKKMIKEALTDYNKAIELGTDDAVTYYNRGVIILEGRTSDLGIADFLKATELDPKFFKAFYNIACAYSLNKDEEKALVYLEKAVDAGLKELDFVMKDPDFDNIRNSDGFKKIIEKLKGK
jgi:tetratricopeptide (TPR) repeat protein